MPETPQISSVVFELQRIRAKVSFDACAILPMPQTSSSCRKQSSLTSGQIAICYQQQIIAQHQLSRGRGEMVTEAAHYAGLPRRPYSRAVTAAPERELMAGPGVGHHFAVPEVEVRSLAVYEEANHVATV